MSKITKKILPILLIIITFIFPFSTVKAASCSQSTNFLARTSGLTLAYQSAYDDLICGLVTDGVWNSLDALYRFDAQNQTTALLNLVSTSYTATVTGTPTFTAKAGFAGNGSNAAIDTNFNPSTAGGNYTQNSAHLSAWDNTSRSGNNSAVLSLNTGVSSFESDIFSRYTDNKNYVRVNDNPASGGFTSTGSSGFFLGNRTSSTARTGYHDNTSVGTYGSVSSGSIPSGNFRFLVNGDHTAWSNDQVRAGSFGSGLNSTQSTALYNRMSAFTTAVQAIPAIDNTTLGYNYLWAAFSPGAPSLHILESNDGISWTDENVSYTPSNAGGYVRDPTIAYFSAQSKFWVAHTNTTFGVANTSFDLGSSTNANIFSAVQQVDMSSLISGANAQVWAPEWIHNPDGSPWLDSNGVPHIIVSASNSGIQDTNFQFYETHPTNANDFSQPWSAPVLITGTSLPGNMIDAYPIVSGSTITLWYKNEATRYVEYMTGSTASLTSGYSVIKSGNWAGWGTPLEGEDIISMGGNNWRIYLDAQGSGYYYSNSTDNGATWSAKTLVTYPYTVQHGTVINIASISASPSTITQNSIGNVITLTGTNTSWIAGTPGTPTFTLSGGTGASIASQTITDSSHASITISAGSAAGTLTITDPSTNTTANVSVTADSVAPTVSVTAPANSATVSGNSVTLSANASDNISVAGVQFKLDTNTNIGAEDTTSTYGVTWDSTGVADGSHTIIAVARDGAGNYATSSAITITVDNTAPVRSVGAPSGTLAYGTTGATLSLTTNENATCKYGIVSGTAYGSISNTFTTTGGTSQSASLTGLSNATSYTYYVRCQDGQGNTNLSDYTISFSVAADSTVPTVSITAPANSATVSGSTVAVSADASDNETVAGVKFYYDDTNLIGSEDTSSPYALTWDSTTVADGSHTLSAVARDNTGNVATSSSVTVTVHNAVSAPVSSGGGGGGFSAPYPTAPAGGFTATRDITNSQNKTVLHFGFGNDITNIAISDNANFTPATYINATSSVEWPATTTKILYIKYCNRYGRCSNPISLQINAYVPAPIVSNSYKFYKNLSYRMTNSDVLELQKYLNSHGFVIAQSGAGSIGKETNYFGLLTYKALIKFQEAYAADILTPGGLKKGTGYFGPSTRAFVNK